MDVPRRRDYGNVMSFRVSARSHGHHIELGEIEAALLRHPEVREAVAVLHHDRTSGAGLIAYIVSADARLPQDLQRQLNAALPQFMVPSAIVPLAAFPRTPSGQVDRAGLPAPSRREPTSSEETSSPLQEVASDSFRLALGLNRVDRDDNFFELGGNSLLAIQVAAWLENALEIPVSPASIFQAPTPRALAEVLDGELRAPRGHLRALQPLGDRPPLFCMSDLMGRPISYLGLARHLAPDQPVYALCPGPLEDAFLADPRSDLLTSTYVTALREVRPTGPYRIVGYSYGGFPAFELAQALRADGEEVELIMIDPYFVQGAPGFRQTVRWLGRLARDLALMLYRDVGRTRVAGRIFLKLRLARVALLQLHHARRRPREIEVPDWVPTRCRELARASIRAIAEHRFQPFAGPTVFLQVTQRSFVEDLMNCDGLNGWAGLLVGSVTRASMPANHYWVMRDPVVAQVADLIRSTAVSRRAPSEGGAKLTLESAGLERAPGGGRNDRRASAPLV
jgi:thioesterase domain-containing protein